MKNILNNKTAKSKRIFTDKDRLGDTVSISGGDERWFARANDQGDYTKLYYSSPLGTTHFKSEEEFIAHLEGDRTVGKYKPNMGRY